MRTVLFMLAALAASVLFSMFNVRGAQARDYPYCLLTGPGPGDCKYTSYAQCEATASGTGYYCQPNFALHQSYGEQGYGPGYARAPRASRAYGYGPQY
ncbi:DUF3551 domain-containing protein [Bradyrhizobium sp. SYSU BS000235]|uniref:DUF3551 domain-containing protein n=1 Tax=Bradyrhizobium sp. SYSU BS000235 TaxID=3411332 RepID=UPI003C7502E0